MNDTDNIEQLPADILPEENQEEWTNEKTWPWRPEKWTDPKEVAAKIEEYFMRAVDWYARYKKNVMFEYQMQSFAQRHRDWNMNVWRKFEEDDEWEGKEPQQPTEWEWVHEYETPTISWLALFLECDIETIRLYKRKDEFSAPIKEAYLRVQQVYEERLHWHNATWAIFALKNFDWKDKQETDLTSGWQPMFWKIKVTIDE